MNKPYYEIDHSHCWEEKKPPCGQRIEHLRCCLCNKLNPKVVERVRLVEEIEKKTEWAVNPHESDDEKWQIHYEGFNEAKAIIINLIKNNGKMEEK